MTRTRTRTRDPIRARRGGRESPSRDEDAHGGNCGVILCGGFMSCFCGVSEGFPGDPAGASLAWVVDVTLGSMFIYTYIYVHVQNGTSVRAFLCGGFPSRPVSCPGDGRGRWLCLLPGVHFCCMLPCRDLSYGVSICRTCSVSCELLQGAGFPDPHRGSLFDHLRFESRSRLSVIRFSFVWLFRGVDVDHTVMMD